MGLFDRFKKNNKNVEDKNSAEALIKKANDLTAVAERAEQAAKDQDDKYYKDLIEKRTARAKKEYQYKSINSRVIVLKDLCNEKKIRLTKQSADKMTEWFKKYQEQMENFDYKDIEAPDLVIPEFPVTTSDIYCQKNRFILCKTLEDLLNPNDLYRSGKEIISSFEEFFVPIKDDDELISVRDGLLIAQAQMDAFNERMESIGKDKYHM